jgi:flagellin-specific chaperone FliS
MVASAQTATQSYRSNQINSASPLDLILMTYDALLMGCGQRNLDRTTRAISLLRNALDFSFDEDVALGLFRLYQYMAEQARKGEYDEVANLARELRDSWVQVKKQYEAVPQIAVNSTPQVTVSLSGQLSA